LQISTTKDLPNWFNLENYKCFENTEMRELYHQVTARRDMLYCVDLLKNFSQLEDSESCNHFFEVINKMDDEDLNKKFNLDHKYDKPLALRILKSWSWMIKGVTIWPDSPMHRHIFPYEEISSNNQDNKQEKGMYELLDGGHIIRPTSLANIKSHLAVAEETFKNTTGKSFDQDFAVDDENIDFNKLISSTGVVCFELDLYSFKNKDLIEDFKRVLKKWRKELAIEVDSNLTFVTPSHRDTIVNYNIIPYIDLLIWAAAHDCKIPHRVFCAALFPFGEKGELEFRQTIKVFADSIINKEYVLK
jgi:hypothetical protein